MQSIKNESVKTSRIVKVFAMRLCCPMRPWQDLRIREFVKFLLRRGSINRSILQLLLVVFGFLPIVANAQQQLDTTAPTATISAPAMAGDSLGTAPTLSGIITDNVGGSGVAQVSVVLWSSGSFVSLDGTALPGWTQFDATLSTTNAESATWTLATSLPPGSYTMTVYPSDVAGNYSPANRISKSFQVADSDTIAPTASISNPAMAGDSLSGGPILSGSITDNAGGSGVARVSVVLWSNGSFVSLDGSALPGWTRFEATLSNTSAESATWTLATTLPPGSYTMTVYPSDVAGNYLPANRVARSFQVVGSDTTAPTATISDPVIAGDSLSASPTLSGSITDNAGGSGVSQVSVVLWSSGSFVSLDGSALPGWTRFDATLSNSNVESATWTLPTTLPPGSYTMTVYPSDVAGNYSPDNRISRTFSVTNAVANVAPLQFGLANNEQFGYQYGGGSDVAEATFSFNRYNADIYISVHGYDIDTKKEVQVKLNGELIGHLTKGDNQSDNGGDVFVLPADDQITGTNQISFHQTKKNGAEQWGVTNLQLIGCEYQVNGTATPANSGTPTVIDNNTGTLIFANFFNSGAIADGTDRYVSVCVSTEDDHGDRFAHFTTDVGLDDNTQIKAYPEFIIGTKFGLVGETSFRPYPALVSTSGFVYPALDSVASLVGVPAFTNELPDIDVTLDIDEQNVVGTIRDVMLESWFYDTSANEQAVGSHVIDYTDWVPSTALPPIDPLNAPDFKAGDAIAGSLNNIVGAGHSSGSLRNLLLEMMVHVGPLSPNDISYNPANPNPDRNPARFRLTNAPVTIGDYQYHIWYGETYLSPLVVFSRETNILGQSLLNLTEEGEINLDWNEFLDYTLYSLEPMMADAGVVWASGVNNIFPRMRSATSAIGGIEFGIEPQTNGIDDEPYRATVRKFEVFIRGKNFGL